MVRANFGQALVEYILVFCFLSFLGMKMVAGINGAMESGLGGLGYALTEELKSGVCKDLCFYQGFKNR